MAYWPLLRTVLIENVIIFMLLMGIYFIYTTEVARFGHCSCDPKLVAMKGQEIYYSGPGSDKLMAHQHYGCICSARDNQSYLTYLLWVSIGAAICGMMIIYLFCCENADTTAKFSKVMIQLIGMYMSFHRKCCETKEEKERREELAKKAVEKKQTEEKHSKVTKFINKNPLTFYVGVIGFIIYILGDGLMKSDKPIMELIQDNKFTSPAIGIGMAMCFIYGVLFIFDKRKKDKDENKEIKEETEEEIKEKQWNKKVDGIALNIINTMGICYIVLAVIGYSSKNNFKFNDLFSFEQWEIPFYVLMTFIFVCIFVKIIVDGEKYLLKQINPAVYDDNYISCCNINNCYTSCCI